MAVPTHTEIIREITRDVELLKDRVDTLRRDVGGIPIQVALLQPRVDDLREGWKIWAARVWMILGPLLGAAVGALLNSYLNKK